MAEAIKGGAHPWEVEINFMDVKSASHCEELTGRANARPMTGSAAKQSSPRQARCGLLRFARNDENEISHAAN
jgi:hypothetical protein